MKAHDCEEHRLQLFHLTVAGADVACPYCRIKELELEAKKCKWCGVPHERGMNTLCPLTIAEARLEAAGNLVGYWRQRYEGGKLADMPMEEYARFLECARDLKQALGGDDE